MNERADQVLGRYPAPVHNPVHFDQGDWPPPPPINIPPRQGHREKRSFWRNDPVHEYCQVCPSKDAEINRLAADLEAAKRIAAEALVERNAAQEMERLARADKKESDERLYQLMMDQGLINKAHMVD